MKHFIALAGAAIVLSCTASAASAQGRNSVERGTRMDTDALRDDVRTNRLEVPGIPWWPSSLPNLRPIQFKRRKAKSRQSQVQEKRRKQPVASGRWNAMLLRKEAKAS